MCLANPSMWACAVASTWMRRSSRRSAAGLCVCVCAYLYVRASLFKNTLGDRGGDHGKAPLCPGTLDLSHSRKTGPCAHSRYRRAYTCKPVVQTGQVTTSTNLDDDVRLWVDDRRSIRCTLEVSIDIDCLDAAVRAVAASAIAMVEGPHRPCKKRYAHLFERRGHKGVVRATASNRQLRVLATVCVEA